ncbi:hypothetical protein [Pseudoalteromonas sp. C12FD-1]|uniref:hypothetical protein n=1 Tax=Pseudoalteromonas sp. C12FD-1 TaxID=3131979 RepID=UPI00307D5C92
MNNSAPVMCEKLLLLQTNDSPCWWFDLFDEIGNEIFDDGQRLISVEVNEIQHQVEKAFEDGFWPTIVAPSMRLQHEVEQFIQTQQISVKVINAVAHKKLLAFLLQRPSKTAIEAYANDALIVFDASFKAALDYKMKTDPFCQLMISRIQQNRVDLNECLLVSSIEQAVVSRDAQFVFEWTFSAIHKFELWVAKDDQYACLSKIDGSDTLKSLIIDGQVVAFDGERIDLNKEQVEWIVNKFKLPESIIEYWNRIEADPGFLDQTDARAIGEAILMLPLNLWEWLAPIFETSLQQTASATRGFNGGQKQVKEGGKLQPLLFIANIDENDDLMKWAISWEVTPASEPRVTLLHNSVLVQSDFIWDEDFTQLSIEKINLTDRTTLGWYYNKETNHLEINLNDNI